MKPVRRREGLKRNEEENRGLRAKEPPQNAGVWKPREAFLVFAPFWHGEAGGRKLKQVARARPAPKSVRE